MKDIDSGTKYEGSLGGYCRLKTITHPKGLCRDQIHVDEACKASIIYWNICDLRFDKMK